MSSPSDGGNAGVVPVGTRVIQLDAGQNRCRAMNGATLAVVNAGLVLPNARSFALQFRDHYPAIRALGRAIAEPGVLVVAIHQRSHQLAGRLWLRGQCGRSAAAIIGRHGHADLFLDADPKLSLRHLGLVLQPLTQWEGSHARYSILDLRTGLAFHDENRRPLSAVRVDGPAMLSAAGYTLMCLPTGEPADWPEDADDAWELLPERVYLEEHEAEPDRWHRKALRAGASGQWLRGGDDAARKVPTMIRALAGPVAEDAALLLPEESPIGALEVISEAGARQMPVGPRALDRGILLGRYGRCEGAELLGHESISRTHLLLYSQGGERLAIDTASTCGIAVAGEDGALERVRLAKLDGPKTIYLGEGSATVKWCPVEGA